ncbi:hypothetical protein GTY65_24585 [Streptomyces sp. SID8379]|uniref:hypothetical protein n=1 Tax=unclassified Streptomyces TaxID=2593676 RepID=UPI001319E6B1|nr:MULTISPECIES: hypothetical protein [unclassified Streptomyces]MYW67219.1 hypothetical protein [Streptomyces sp. SID8379]
MPVNEHPDPTLCHLNETVLEANGWPPFSGTFDLLSDGRFDLPTQQGVYVFLAGGKKIAYPRGESSIVYLGKGEGGRRGVRGRVGRHRGYIKQGPHERYVMHPAHEWIMARGGSVLYSLAPDGSGSAGMERKLREAFKLLHRTRPVGNGIDA